jgi:protein gp37
MAEKMSDHSKIEWTDATWSTSHGCDKCDDLR